MPDANFQFVTSLNFAGRSIPLKRPMVTYAARKLEAILPQIAALNAARKTRTEAAAALGTTITSLSRWIELTQTTWLGKENKTKLHA